MKNLNRNRCWLEHRYKEDWDFCPLCHAPLRWVYVNDNWTPCDREAIAYSRDLDGTLLIYNGKELLKYCKEYKIGTKATVRLGLLPHVFSCSECKGYHGTKVKR